MAGNGYLVVREMAGIERPSKQGIDWEWRWAM